MRRRDNLCTGPHITDPDAVTNRREEELGARVPFGARRRAGAVVARAVAGARRGVAAARGLGEAGWRRVFIFDFVRPAAEHLCRRLAAALQLAAVQGSENACKRMQTTISVAKTAAK